MEVPQQQPVSEAAEVKPVAAVALRGAQQQVEPRKVSEGAGPWSPGPANPGSAKAVYLAARVLGCAASLRSVLPVCCLVLIQQCHLLRAGA